jgi:DNA topoisomerase-1
MRTDSTNLSWLAINSIRKYIKEEFGEKYLSEKARVYKSKQAFAQEAHEAIRPTFVANILLPTKKGITEDHQTLYQLIWSRSVACQMKEAKLAITEVFIKAANYTFVATGQTLQFEGFTKIYPVKIDLSTIPLLKIAETLNLIKLENEQNFTKPPYRYNPASLIKELEEKGIGRPSTYAPIISILLFRGYAFLQKGYFTPSEIGLEVCDIIQKNFPEIIDYNFTAKMESDLDRIAQGQEKYQKILGDFYWPFQEKLDIKMKEVPKTKIALEKIDEKCPKCGGKLAFRLSRFGRFIGCSNFPKCRYTKSMNGKNACPPVPGDGRRACPTCPTASRGGRGKGRKGKKGKKSKS